MGALGIPVRSDNARICPPWVVIRRRWSLVPGAALIADFLSWAGRTRSPKSPLRLFQGRAFNASNAVSFLTSLGMVGSTFLLSQFFQVAQNLGLLDAEYGFLNGPVFRLSSLRWRACSLDGSETEPP